MRETRDGWLAWVCPICTGVPGGLLCRGHTVEAHEAWAHADFEEERIQIGKLAGRLDRYERAFTVDYQGTDTVADRAALIAGAGWASGWGQLWDFWTAEASHDEAAPVQAAARPGEHGSAAGGRER